MARPGASAAESVASGGSRAGYHAFRAAVARRQLTEWLPDPPARVLDLSGPGGGVAELAQPGHRVLRVVPSCPGPAGPAGPGPWLVADTIALDGIRDDAVDAVVADDSALSRSLCTELTVEQLARVLRPGGRLFGSADSLRHGMALLANQSRWAELADLPAAELLLVPEPDGSIRRCFRVEELGELVAAAGLVVEWVGSRTVLARDLVNRALAVEPGGLAALVDTELEQAAHGTDVGGEQVLVRARKPGPGG
jgi:hypothetical protein